LGFRRWPVWSEVGCDKREENRSNQDLNPWILLSNHDWELNWIGYLNDRVVASKQFVSFVPLLATTRLCFLPLLRSRNKPGLTRNKSLPSILIPFPTPINTTLQCSTPPDRIIPQLNSSVEKWRLTLDLEQNSWFVTST